MKPIYSEDENSSFNKSASEGKPNPDDNALSDALINTTEDESVSKFTFTLPDDDDDDTLEENESIIDVHQTDTSKSDVDETEEKEEQASETTEKDIVVGNNVEAEIEETTGLSGEDIPESNAKPEEEFAIMQATAELDELAKKISEETADTDDISVLQKETEEPTLLKDNTEEALTATGKEETQTEKTPAATSTVGKTLTKAIPTEEKKEEVKQPKAPSSVINVTPPTPTPPSNNGNSSSSKVILIIILAVAILGGGAAAYFLLGPSSDKSDTEKSEQVIADSKTSQENDPITEVGEPIAPETIQEEDIDEKSPEKKEEPVKEVIPTDIKEIKEREKAIAEKKFETPTPVAETPKVETPQATSEAVHPEPEKEQIKYPHYTTINYSTGNVYKGYINSAGKKHGKGTYTWTSGDRYEGDWINDLATGQGIYYSHEGWRYEGGFANLKFHGEGVYYFTNGKNRKGRWINGQMQK